jgi:hypothetical protein
VVSSLSKKNCEINIIELIMTQNAFETTFLVTKLQTAKDLLSLLNLHSAIRQGSNDTSINEIKTRLI